MQEDIETDRARRLRPQRAIIILSLVLALGAAALTAWEVHIDRQETLADGQRTAEMAVAALEQHTIETFAAGTSAIASVDKLMAQAGGFTKVSPEQAHEWLKALTPSNGPLDRLTLFDERGWGYATTVRPRPPQAKYFVKHPGIAPHVAGQTGNRLLIELPLELPSEAIIYGPMNSPGSSRWVIPLTRSLYGPDGKFEGVIAVTFRVDYFKEFYGILGNHRDASISLLRDDDMLLARHPFRPEFLGVNSNPTIAQIKFLQDRGDLPIVTSRLDNIERLFATRTVHGLPLKVTVGLSTSDILESWSNRVAQRLLAFGIFCATVLALAVLLLRRLRAHDEAELRYRVLFESATVGILLFEEGRLIDCNPRALTFFGVKARSRLLGQSRGELIEYVTQTPQGEAGEPMEKEWRIRRENGGDLSISAEVSQFIIHEREYELVIMRDISRRKLAESRLHSLNQELEERVRSRTSLLAQANNDLEAFSYSASHDLRAPIRRVRSFAEAIVEDHGGVMPPDAARMLERIHHSAVQMDGLLNDLLVLFKANREPMQPCALDVGVLAQAVMAEITTDQPQRRRELQIQTEGMQAYGDKGLLRLALTNLLGNAWKYSARTELTRIDIGRDKENFYVRDNGAGFDMQHIEQLFMPFQRLHAQNEFEGTGIGLAIVRRVIERHGGCIWAESTPGEGACFYFTLGTQAEIDALLN